MAGNLQRDAGRILFLAWAGLTATTILGAIAGAGLALYITSPKETPC